MNYMSMNRKSGGSESWSSNLMQAIRASIIVFSSLASAWADSAQHGVLITAFTNPVPSSFANFGWSVAAVGSDQVLVGAPSHKTGWVITGAAYLFNTNGTLLTTFTNPYPQAGSFGRSVAKGSGGLVLIDNYLFNTNGALLIALTNPSPASVFGFGTSIATVGSDRVLVGTDG